MKRLALISSVMVVASLTVMTPAGASAAPTLAAVNSFPVLQGSSGPIGDVSLTEAAVGQLQVGEVLSYKFSAAGASTVHFSTAGTVSGTNGLAGTVAVASSSGTLTDLMKVTITDASTGSFPGVLTLSGLTAAVDALAVAGPDSVTVTSSNAGTPAPIPSSVSNAQILASGTSRATLAAANTPTILSTGNTQSIGSVTLTEPTKTYFKTGDVITFSLRDVNGSSDTVGLSGAPLAAGGSMTVAVAGANGPNVQVNDTAFKVNIVAGDPSNGSASTLTVSNLEVNTAKAPIGPVTLSAVVTSGAGSATEYISPGRVGVANVGGNTSTSSAGKPALVGNTANQVAANVTVSVAAGSLRHGDTFSLQTQPTGVTFTPTAPPPATVTSGNLVLQASTATVDVTGTTATWKVETANSSASTVVLGPINYDIASGVPADTAVTVLASGDAGSAFTSEIVANAVIDPTPSVGSFVASTPTPSVNGSPYTGADVTFTETGSGSTAAGDKIVLISPYATQIAAYRTTFTAVPTVSAPSNGMVLGTPTVNNSAQVVPTANGLITAPAQTVVSIPVVTASSTGPSSFTISGIGYKAGSFVPPGAFVLAGTVQRNSSAVGGNQVVDLVNTYNLGTTSATTPPNASFTQTPSALTNLDYATFGFASDQADTTFACALDGHLISLKCSSPNTVAGLASGSHTFSVEAFNAAGYSSGPLSYTWTIDGTAPSATVALPTSVTAPVTVSFSEPVNHISATTMTLSVVEAGTTTPSALGYTLSCISGNSAPEPCLASSTYTKVLVQSDANLIPGQHYVLDLNPATVSPEIGDEAGNPVASTTQNFRGPLTIDETAAGTVPAWRKASAKGASGGSYAVAHLSGETADFSFTGPSVTWQTATGPTQGKAKVYVDGALKTTVNNYASSMHYGIARTVSGLTDGSHTLKVVTSGVKGSKAGTDTQVIVDAFIVGGVKTEQTVATYTWRRIAASSASGGTYAVEDLAGATYSMTFRGTAITWRTVSGPTMGKASVYIDGAIKTTYNNYSASSRYKDLTIPNLSDDIHTIKIVVLGQHVSSATGSNIAVDQFRVT